MKKHTFKDWIVAVRYWSFSVSAFPVLVTSAFLAYRTGFGDIDWCAAMLAVVSVMLFHAAGNLFSDVGDYRSGADCEEAFAVPNLVKHIFEPKEYLCLAWVLLAVASALGIYLSWRCSWQLLTVGAVGMLLTLLYTKSKNVYLSDLNIFAIFGVLIMLGTSVVALGYIDYAVLLLSVPVGFITLSVLHANNTVDIETDGAAGLHTVAMALGFKRSARFYVAYQLIPFLFVIGCVCFGIMPWTALLCLLAFVPAMGNIKKALGYKEHGREALMGLDMMSAKLQLIFSLLLAVGLFIGALL